MNKVVEVRKLCLLFSMIIRVASRTTECVEACRGSVSGDGGKDRLLSWSRQISNGSGVSDDGHAFFPRPPAYTRPTSSMLYSCRG